MSLELFWGGAPIPQASGRDQAIAQGAELDELGYHEYEGDSEEGSEPEYYNPQTGDRSRKRRGTGVAREPTKRRVPGGIAPIAKPITADYDSDDARIIELKQQMYSDEYVSIKLAEEGRIRYAPKTVGSRWTRIRRIMDKREDEKLDEELSDWHEGEDGILTSVFKDIEKKYEEERAKLEIKKWKDVSMHLAAKLGKRKYTGKACRERFDGLQNGTALKPIEIDRDQAGRRRMREERIAAAKKARTDAEAAVKRAEQLRSEKLETKRREAAEANQKRVMAALEKQAEKDQRERVKEDRKVSKEKARHARLRILAKLRRERDWMMTKARAEKALYRQLTGNNFEGKPSRAKGRGKSRKSATGYYSDDEESMINDLESDENEAQETGDEDEENASAEESDEAMIDDSPPLRRTSLSLRVKLATPALKVVATKAALTKVPVTEETLLNPRSILDDAELDILLHFRDIPRRQANEAHANIVARLAAADQALKSNELDHLLAHASEKVKGKKVDKIRRLQEADAKKSRMAELGLTSTDVDFMETYEAYKDDEYRSILDNARRDSVME